MIKRILMGAVAAVSFAGAAGAATLEFSRDGYDSVTGGFSLTDSFFMSVDLSDDVIQNQRYTGGYLAPLPTQIERIYVDNGLFQIDSDVDDVRTSGFILATDDVGGVLGFTVDLTVKVASNNTMLRSKIFYGDVNVNGGFFSWLDNEVWDCSGSDPNFSVYDCLLPETGALLALGTITNPSFIGYSFLGDPIPPAITQPKPLPGCGPSGGRPPKCNPDIPAVPLPAALPMLLAGIGGLGFMARRKRVTGRSESA